MRALVPWPAGEIWQLCSSCAHCTADKCGSDLSSSCLLGSMSARRSAITLAASSRSSTVSIRCCRTRLLQMKVSTQFSIKIIRCVTESGAVTAFRARHQLLQHGHQCEQHKHTTSPICSVSTAIMHSMTALTWVCMCATCLRQIECKKTHLCTVSAKFFSMSSQPGWLHAFSNRSCRKRGWSII